MSASATQGGHKKMISTEDAMRVVVHEGRPEETSTVCWEVSVN